jgi:hypothetical protein
MDGSSGLECSARDDTPQERYSTLNTRAYRQQLRMLKPAGRTVRSIIEHPEKLNDVFYVFLNKIRHSVVGNAPLMQEEPNFCSPCRLALLRKFTVGKNNLHLIVPSEPL